MRSDDSFPAFVAEMTPQLHATASLLTGDARQAAALTTLALTATSRRWRRLDRSTAAPAARQALVRSVLTGSSAQAAQRLGDDLADSDLAYSVLAGSAPASGLSAAERAWLAGLADLPVRARVALVLRLHDGLAEDEAARLLDTGTATVAGLVDAALRQLGPLLDAPPDARPDAAPSPPPELLLGPSVGHPDDPDDPDDDPYAAYRRPR